MKKLNDASKEKNGKAFMDSTPEQRHDLLVALEKEQKDYMAAKKKDDAADKKEPEPAAV